VGRPESYERELEAAISTMGFFSLIGRKKKGRPSKKERQGRNGQSAVRESALTEEQYRPRQQQQQAPSYTAPQSSSNMAAVATAIAAAPPPPPPPAAIESPDSSAEQKLLQQQQQESAQAGIDLTRSLVKKVSLIRFHQGFSRIHSSHFLLFFIHSLLPTFGTEANWI